ncbi:unnamed protein product [Caenorhabditis brenneri]
MNEIIADVQSVLQVPRGICRLLLQAYHWNKDTLFDRFYESPDTATHSSTLSILVLRKRIHDKCVYVEHRRKILSDHCKEGYDYNFWKFGEQPF